MNPSPDAVLFEARGLAVHFGALRAVAGVDLAIAAGDTLALVGESGCGKSTLARAIAGLVAPSAGKLLFDGEATRRRVGRAPVQMVFQDPQASLNPRLTIGAQVAEAVQLRGSTGNSRSALDARVAELFGQVGIDPGARDRYPHAFSGGQRQRIALARALGAEPRLLICDEVTSALDVSIQAQILNLLARLQRELGLAMLFITHDLAVARHVARRICVMYLGQVVEEAPVEALFGAPAHPYTRALLAAVPKPGEPPGAGLQGEMPSAAEPPGGCPFHPRCAERIDGCATRVPAAAPTREGGWSRCHLVVAQTAAETDAQTTAQTAAETDA